MARVTLEEFLAARLDEDEATAKAAAKVEPEDKETSGWYGHAQWVAKYGTVVDACDDDYAMMIESTDEVCAHIARHDPARVLREVEAKRRRLERYLGQSGYDLPDGVQEGRDPDERESDQAVKDALEQEVREDAAVYSDHPDYDEAWRP